MRATPVRATTLAPFHYGHLAIQSGVATIPDCLPDRAVAFGLAAALGLMSNSLVPPQMDYRGHLAAMPWRTSVFRTSAPRLLPPMAKRSDLGVEGGYQDRIRRATSSGNMKEYFFIQEVPPGQEFHGYIFGASPFEITGHDQVVTRIGAGRTGILCLERVEHGEPVFLNAATGALFGRQVALERYLLNDLQISPPMAVHEASLEVAQWRS